jgi:hypothetical protein
MLGVSGFLTKPLNMKLLREMVILALDNKGSECRPLM